jgi:hypothetical protein
MILGKVGIDMQIVEFQKLGEQLDHQHILQLKSKTMKKRCWWQILQAVIIPAKELLLTLTLVAGNVH